MELSATGELQPYHLSPTPRSSHTEPLIHSFSVRTGGSPKCVTEEYVLEEENHSAPSLWRAKSFV